MEVEATINYCCTLASEQGIRCCMNSVSEAQSRYFFLLAEMIGWVASDLTQQLSGQVWYKLLRVQEYLNEDAKMKK